MHLSPVQRRNIKRTGLITVIFLLVLLIVLQIIGNRLNPFVGKLLKDNVAKSTDSLYRLDFSRVNITLADQHIRIFNIHIHPDTAIYLKKKTLGDAPAMLYDITIPEFSVGWISVLKAYFYHELSIRSIEIIKPTVLITQLVRKPPKPFSRLQLDPYQLIAGTFSSAGIKKISIINGTLHFSQRLPKPMGFSLSNLNIQLKDIKIDSTAKSDTIDLMKSAEVSISFTDLNYQTPDSLYQILIDQFNYSSKKDLSVKNLQLIANEPLYNKLKANGKAPSFLYQIQVPLLNIDSLNLYKLFLRSTLQVGHVAINNPEITIAQNGQKNTQKSSGQSTGSLYEIINIIFSSVSSSQLSISNALLNLVNSANNDSYLKLSNCNLAFKNVAIDSISNMDTSRILASKDIELNINQFSYLLGDSLYRLKLVGIRASVKNSSASVDSMLLIPRYDRFNFMKVAGYSVTRVQLAMPGIALQRIDFHKLLQNAGIKIGKVDVANISIQAYCDQRFPDNKNIAPTVHGLLFGLKFPLIIDTLNVKKMNVVYEELNEHGKEPGKTTFDKLTIQALNITNDEGQLAKNPVCSATMRGLLFNSGLMNVHVAFYLKDKTGKFTVNGTVDPMVVTAFNPMVMPVTGAKILSGNLTKAFVTITADDDKAKGSVNAYYNNLKLDFSNAGDLKKSVSLKEKAIGTFATDAADADNPSGKKPPRVGNIDYKRSKTQFVINYAWKSIFEGLKSIVFEKAINVQKTIKQVKDNFKSLGKKNKDKTAEK